MSAAVFGRYWGTGGGAEKFGGAIAQRLARSGPVDLLTFEPVDLDWLADRLQLELGGVAGRVLEDMPGAVERASADYDRFVNISFMSDDRAAHKNSLYVVHFPTPRDGHIPGWKRALLDGADRVLPGSASLDWGPGFHHADGGRRTVVWSAGRGVLLVATDPEEAVEVEIVLSHLRPRDLGPVRVGLEVDGEEVTAVEVTVPETRLDGRRGLSLTTTVRSPAPGVPVELAVTADPTFVPAEVLGTDDRRVLGVPISGIRLGRGPRALLGRRFSSLIAPRRTLGWIDSYGALVSNSEFTREWVQRYWERDSAVLFPPVTLQPPAAKEPVILNVGRFFPAHQGHSKKQLELVRAFRTLHDSGAHGWELHLVGGCAADGEGYLRQVQAEAEGYPVHLHVNASGETLRDLYGRASIYWHASGLGEHPLRHPDRLEHFGITTVEAMSAGAVPVVVGLAGQLETVRHGLDGYHFDTIPELVALTRAVIADPEDRARLSRSAAERASSFSVAAFEQRLDDILDQLDGASSEGATR